MRILKSHPLLKSYNFSFSFLRKSRLGEKNCNFSSSSYKCTKRSRSEENDELEGDTGESSKRTKIEQSDNTPNKSSESETPNELEGNETTQEISDAETDSNTELVTTLLNARALNEHQSIFTRAACQNTGRDFLNSTLNLNRVQSNMLDPFYRDQLSRTSLRSGERLRDITQNMSNLDANDVRQQTDLVNLQRELLNEHTRVSNMAHNIIKEVLQNSTPQYERLKADTDQRARLTSSALNDHLANIQQRTNIENAIEECGGSGSYPSCSSEGVSPFGDSGDNSGDNDGGDVSGDNDGGDVSGDNDGGDNTGDNDGGDNTGDNNGGDSSNRNTGSLLDDFADVSQEQPSYMDPED